MTTLNVVFDDCWLTLVADPMLSVHASYPERTSADEVDGEVRAYAGGRLRSITSARQRATFPLVLQLLGDADVALLKAWRGQMLLLRDGEGRRVFGTFFSRTVVDYWDPAGTLHDVEIVFSELTYDENVT